MIVRELITRLSYKTDDRGAHDYEARFNALRARAAGVVAAIAAVAAAVGTIGTLVARAGDRMTASLAKIESAIGRSATSAGEAEDVYSRLYDASLRTGVSANDSADAFARFNLAMRDLGRPAGDTVDLIEGLQAAAINAGVGTQELTGAMIQLGQALASGKLQGDEFRTLRENMPAFLRDVARELNVTMAQLMEQAEKGLLTPARLILAMLNASRTARQELSRAPLTMARAWATLGNATARFLADIDRATQLSQILAHMFRRAGQGIEWMRQKLAPVGRIIRDLVERLGGADAVARTLMFGLTGLAVALAPLWVTAAAVAAAFVALGAAFFFCWAIAEDFFAWVTGEDIDTLFGQMFGDFANVAQPFIDAWNWMERTVLAALRTIAQEWSRFTNSEQVAEMGRILSGVAALILDAWGPVKQFFVDLWDSIQRGADAVMEAIRPLVELVERLVGAVSRLTGSAPGSTAAQTPSGVGSVGEAGSGGTGITTDPATGQRRVRQGLNRAGRPPISLQSLTTPPSAGLTDRMPGTTNNVHQEAVVNINQTVNATGPNPAEIAAAAGMGTRQASGASVEAWQGAFSRALAGAHSRVEPAAQ
ncbi:tape measure protein [Roseomonas sp. HJA6]|uniref:Tape measure protein n=1 Tax=Roseomonas alba TaxID=2846776 RepID=A0ABS7A235_9PROT|nr:tape measure protein [Neoroseomonas alba]